MKILLYLIFILTAIINCTPKNYVRGAKMESAMSIVSFGYIEKRDSTHSLYVSDNFLDMLKFEFVNARYSIVDVEKKTESESLKQPIEEPVKSKEISPLDELVTEEKEEKDQTEKRKKKQLLRNVFGNHRNLEVVDIAGENVRFQRPLKSQKFKPQEIKELAEEYPFHYFIQGVVSVVDDNDLLNSKSSSYVFLDIFDREGERAGLINFAIEKEKLHDAELLKKTCAEIVKEFDLRFKKK